MSVELLKTSDESQWDEYVKKHPESSLFYLIECRNIISDLFGYKPIYLIAREGGRIAGILPLFLIDGFLNSRRLISIPFSVYGGVCADSNQIEQKLINRAVEESDIRNVKYLECRHLKKKINRLTTRITYTTFLLNLNQDIELIFRGFRKSLRRQIKKSMDHGLVVNFSSRDISSLYKFYSKYQRRFGTPVQHYKWYSALFNHFPENHFIAEVKLENKVIAAFLMRQFNGTVSEIIGNDLPEYRTLNPNLFLEWNLIQYACENNYHTYDFGRSIKTSGTYHFKLGWGAKPCEMHYQYYMRTSSIPDFSQTNPRRKIFARFWRHLPLEVTNRIGPFIRKRYP